MAKIAILGMGTVGTGVARVIAENGEQIRRKLGESLEIKRILVRTYRESPYRPLMTDDFREIEGDPEICAVVECIGGANLAYDYTRRALSAGKHVISSNKQLVAEKGAELLSLAKEKGVHYLFEGSVGGGIPVLHPMTHCLPGNRIDEVYGILNGTTNYILTRMVKGGASFAEALKEAQAKGYAEADPTDDVEGIDAGRKICILADLAFGRQVDPRVVPMNGISGMDLEDVRIADEGGWRMKLLGRALRLPDGRRTAYVAPHLLPADHPMANVQDVYNAVAVWGNATGELMFYGRGAGAAPTASACVSDILEALRTEGGRDEVQWSPETEGFFDPAQLEDRWYFRISGSLRDAEEAFGPVESLCAAGETAFITERMSETEAQSRAGELQVLANFRVLDGSKSQDALRMMV